MQYSRIELSILVVPSLAAVAIWGGTAASWGAGADFLFLSGRLLLATALIVSAVLAWACKVAGRGFSECPWVSILAAGTIGLLNVCSAALEISGAAGDRTSAAQAGISVVTLGVLIYWLREVVTHNGEEARPRRQT